MINSITLDGELLPFPKSMDMDYDVVENVYKTEAGTDQVGMTRSEKLTVSLSFDLSSSWVRKMRELSLRQELNAVIDEAGVEKERRVRIRNFKASLVEDSRRTEGTAGLWSVSFDLIEY